jgi:hypothetical protein
MEAVIGLCRAGSLAIYSRSGQYVRRSDGRPLPVNRKGEIGGTLIIWDLTF